MHRRALLAAGLTGGLAAGASAQPRGEAGGAEPLAEKAAVIDPRSFGATGTGQLTPITRADITAHPGWIGSYSPGNSWDYVGVQEALYAAFATESSPGKVVWNSLAMRTELNRAVYFPGGDYRINRQLKLVASGFYIHGAGRRAARLTWAGPDDLAMLYCDAVSYGTFANVGFDAGKPTHEALVELDWTGSNSGLKTQQITFDTCMWSGSGRARIGLRISKSGGGAQGDTIVLANPYFGGFSFAGLAAGVESAQNVLGVQIIGGDFQANPRHGIYCAGAQVFVQGTSFQNQSADPRNNQIANGGADLTCAGGAGAGANSAMTDVRSESDVLCRAAGTTVRINGSSLNGGVPVWQPNTTYPKGALVKGTPGLGQKGEKGRTFMCVVAGRSGNTEPAWDKASRGIASVQAFEGVRTVAGSRVVTGNMEKLPLGSAPSAGDYIAIVGASTSGALDVFFVMSVENATSITLSEPPERSLENAQFYLGSPLSDSGVKWIDLDFDSVSGAALYQTSLGLGRVASTCTVVQDCTFARADALRAEMLMEPPLPGTLRRVSNVRCTAGALDQPYVLFNPLVQDGYNNGGPLQPSYSTAQNRSINFDGGAGHTAYPHVALRATAAGDLELVGRTFVTGGLATTPDPEPLLPAPTIDISDRAARYGAVHLDLDQDVTMTLNHPPQDGKLFVVMLRSADSVNRALTFGTNFSAPAGAVRTGTSGVAAVRQFMMIKGKAVNIGGADGLV